MNDDTLFSNEIKGKIKIKFQIRGQSPTLMQKSSKFNDPVQVADDFMDITSPLKAMSDAAVAPFGKLALFLFYYQLFCY